LESANFREKILLFLLYISLLIGFYFDENLNYGSYLDWIKAYNPVLEDFSKDFKNTLLKYDSYGQRHSPVYIVFLSILLKFGLSFDFVRLIHLHICLGLILIFYSCLKLKFKDTNRTTLRLLALSIFLSPTFRSLAIWPDSRIPGLIFFILSIYFFLKFLLLAKNQKKFAWCTLISIITSSYISPNFSLFYIYFIYYFFQNLKFKEFLFLVLFSFAASAPMIYYVFFLDINFITAGKTPALDEAAKSLSFNISNKILIISSIILFHLIPVLYFLLDYKKIILFLKSNIIFILISFSILAYFFNYQSSFTGGGVFFQLSQILFNNNLIFFIISFFSLSLIIYLSTLHKDNFIFILLLIMSNIQNTIYHKYYEPLILIMIFLIFNNLNYKKFFSKKINLTYLYGFSFFYIFLRIFKNIYLM
tara:strand:+ start:42 stop:1298 length:1257 start_codon:yes stop_codon:yes gene_type:complete